MGHLQVSRALNALLVGALLVVSCAKTSTDDYVDAIETWTEEKLARVERARREPRTRIWSARCERQGKDAIAFEADGKPIEIRCVERRVLKV